MFRITTRAAVRNSFQLRKRINPIMMHRSVSTDDNDMKTPQTQFQRAVEEINDVIEKDPGPMFNSFVTSGIIVLTAAGVGTYGLGTLLNIKIYLIFYVILFDSSPGIIRSVSPQETLCKILSTSRISIGNNGLNAEVVSGS